MNLSNYKSMPLSFSNSEAMQSFMNGLFHFFKEAKLNPFRTEEWKQGIFQLFGVQAIHLPNLEAQNYILSSNHISDLDAIILGLLHPRVRIVAKIGWTANKDLMDFLKLHYDIVGVYRNFEIDKLNDDERKIAKKHNFNLFRDISKYLKDTSEVHHLLIFPQGTISDINRNSKDRVSAGFAKIANATNTSVVNIFTEYPEIGSNMRIVCGIPYAIVDRNIDYSQAWLNDVLTLQNQLDDVRSPVLSEKHSLNNAPDEPFF